MFVHGRPVFVQEIWAFVRGKRAVRRTRRVFVRTSVFALRRHFFFCTDPARVRSRKAGIRTDETGFSHEKTACWGEKTAFLPGRPFFVGENVVFVQDKEDGYLYGKGVCLCEEGVFLYDKGGKRR